MSIFTQPTSKQATHKKQGFTLIEILVVMAIIGILATVGGSSFLVSRLRGRDVERKSSLGQVQRALEMYYNDYSRYPDSAAGRISGCGPAGDAACDWGETFENDSTVYMAQLPSDPRAPDQQYFYEASVDGQRYRLYTRLENTQDLATDLDENDVTGDSYDGTHGDGLEKTCGQTTCNYGVPSSSTNMTEAL